MQLSGGSPAIDSRDVLPNDKWLHLACVYDGSQGKKFVYVNGELQGELPDTRGTIDLTQAYGHDKMQHSILVSLQQIIVIWMGM